MWTQPRATIQRIVDDDPYRLVLVLAALSGIVNALSQAGSDNLGDDMGLPAILGIAVVAGTFSGIFSLYIGAALVGWTGRWIGGKASYAEIRCAFAWSSVPFLWASLVWIPRLILFRQELFMTEMPRIEASVGLIALYFAFLLVEVAGAIWAIVCCLMALGQVQGFTAFKALGNFGLAALVIAVPLAILAGAIFMLTGF
jgi:hypothetical protein